MLDDEILRFSQDDDRKGMNSPGVEGQSNLTLISHFFQLITKNDLEGRFYT
jgi:hypothetical protein